MRIRVRDLLDSEFVRSESDFEPNYVLTPLKRRIHRVKVVGSIRSEPIFGTQGTFARFLLDDSTGAIWVSGFHARVSMFERLAMGDLVQLLATVNEYRGRLELVAEAVAVVQPNLWLLHRAEVVRAELEGRREYEKAKSILVHERNIIEARETAREIGLDTEVLESLHSEVEGEETVDMSEEILEVLSSLDAGGGVPLTELVESLKGSHSSEEVEREVIRLMDLGEVYEPTVGRYARI